MGLVDPKKPQNTKHKPYKFTDEQRMVTASLVESGMSHAKAGEIMGISSSHVTNIVHVIEGQKDIVEWYRANKAQALAAAQVEDLGLQQKIRDSIDDGVIAGMTVDQKARWFQALTIDHGTKYDKERIEMGESTENVAVLVSHIKDIRKKRKHGKG